MLLSQLGLRKRHSLQLKLQSMNKTAYGTGLNHVDPVTLRDLSTISVTFHLFYFEVRLLPSLAAFGAGELLALHTDVLSIVQSTYPPDVNHATQSLILTISLRMRHTTPNT